MFNGCGLVSWETCGNDHEASRVFFLSPPPPPVGYVAVCSDGWLQAIWRTHFPSSPGYFEILVITQKTTVQVSSFMKTQSLIYFIDFLTSLTSITLRSSVVHPQLPTQRFLR
jgi:hypothetical protein